MFDVAIVGAGPAGSATAVHLAQSNHSVALLDGSTFPRRKPCGEGIFPAGVAELDALGARGAIAGSAVAIESIRFRGYGRSVSAAIGAPGRHGLGLERERLDAALIEAAARAGAQVMPGKAVTRLVDADDRWGGVLTEGGRVEARVFVGADGANSRLRRLAGLGRNDPGSRYGVSAHVVTEKPVGRQIEVCFEPESQVYLTPVGERTANVAVLTSRAGMRPFGGHLREAFESAARRHPALSCDFQLLDEPRAAGPFPVRSRRSWQRNLVLAGDAAGFYDGISGEGISLALASARCCAGAVAAYLDSGDETAFARYDRQRRSLARPSELLARLALLLAGHPALARRALGNLARRPQVFARLVAINGRDLPLSALRPGDLFGLLFGL